MEQGYIVTSESELPRWDVVVKRVNVRTKLGIGIPREIRQPALRGHGRIDVVAMQFHGHTKFGLPNLGGAKRSRMSAIICKVFVSIFQHIFNFPNNQIT